jgi:phenylalanyl-tRNA synthetase beta chain
LVDAKIFYRFLYAEKFCKYFIDKLNLETEEVSLEDERFSDALEIVSKGKTIARLGKVSPKLLKDFDIEQECFYAEIELETAQN